MNRQVPQWSRQTDGLQARRRGHRFDKQLRTFSFCAHSRSVYPWSACFVTYSVVATYLDPCVCSHCQQARPKACDGRRTRTRAESLSLLCLCLCFPFLFSFLSSYSFFYGSTVYGSSVLRLNKLWRAPSHERKLNIWARWVLRGETSWVHSAYLPPPQLTVTTEELGRSTCIHHGHARPCDALPSSCAGH